MPEWGSVDLELLADCVRTELQVVNGMQELGLSDEVVDQLAWGVVTGIDYGFDVRWRPKWLKPGEPHLWTEDDVTYARCTDCVEASPGVPSENDARRWYESHRATEHGEAERS